ncbi:MAG: hypothetical protein MZV63_66090 [Marinilabiliales bacterium]|nr:hypothetical protein [Marinilabiliales bacterium]
MAREPAPGPLHRPGAPQEGPPGPYRRRARRRHLPQSLGGGPGHDRPADARPAGFHRQEEPGPAHARQDLPAGPCPRDFRRGARPRGGGRGRGPGPRPLPAGRFVAARRQAAARVDRRGRRRNGRRPVHPRPRRHRSGQDRGRAAGARLLPLHDGTARRLRPPRARLRPGRFPGRRGPAARGRARAPVAPRRRRPGPGAIVQGEGRRSRRGLASPRRRARRTRPSRPRPPRASTTSSAPGRTRRRSWPRSTCSSSTRTSTGCRASSSRPWPRACPSPRRTSGRRGTSSPTANPASSSRPATPGPWPMPIVKIHFDKNLAARLAAGGREAVLEKYSAEAMARRIIGVYEFRAHRKGIKLA